MKFREAAKRLRKQIGEKKVPGRKLFLDLNITVLSFDAKQVITSGQKLKIRSRRKQRAPANLRNRKLSAAFPIERTAVQVHYRFHINGVSTHAVNNGVGKAMKV